MNNKFKVISCFSGCGGSSLGYKLAGCNVILAVEFIKEAWETYNLNNPDTPILKMDIRDITINQILDITGITKYELDILDGSPPCSSFSINGVRDKNWGKINKYSSTLQRTDDLFDEYIRIIEGLMPKIIIAENVKGLTMGKSKDYLYKIINNIEQLGYNVDYKVLNSANYSVPQNRERVIIQGIRKDLNKVPIWPSYHDKKITTKDAIGHLIDIDSDMPINTNTKRYKLMKQYFRPLCTSNDINNICKTHNLKVYNQSFRRDKWNEPYYTIKQHHTRPFHPIKDRTLSIEEARILMSFPENFKFVPYHSPKQNWERLGRSVPPLLIKAVISNIIENILYV